MEDSVSAGWDVSVCPEREAQLNTAAADLYNAFIVPGTGIGVEERDGGTHVVKRRTIYNAGEQEEDDIQDDDVDEDVKCTCGHSHIKTRWTAGTGTGEKLELLELLHGSANWLLLTREMMGGRAIASNTLDQLRSSRPAPAISSLPRYW